MPIDRVDSAVIDLAILSHFYYQRIQIDDGIESLRRPILPCLYFLLDAVCDFRYQAPAIFGIRS